VEAGDVKEFNGERSHQISIKNSVLLNHSFIANMRGTIKTHGQLVDKYREITLCFPLASRLDGLALDLAHDQKLNDEKDLIDESTRTANGYSYKKITNPHVLSIFELREILLKDGMQDEKPLRKLVLDVKKGDKEYTEKYNLAVTESLSVREKAAENRAEILTKYSPVIGKVTAGLVEEIKKYSQKEVIDLLIDMTTSLTDDDVKNHGGVQVVDTLLSVLKCCADAFKSEDVCIAKHAKAEQDLVIFGEYSREIMKIITELEVFFDRKFLKGRTDFPEDDAVTCAPW
jgi:hypothetical protein